MITANSREERALARLEEEEVASRKRTMRKFIATLNLFTKRLRSDDFLFIIKEKGYKTKLELPMFKVYYEDQVIDWKNEDGFMEKLEVTREIKHTEATCLICYGDYKENSRVCFSRNENCKHHFHRNCLLKWLTADYKTACPICQNEYNSNRG